MLAFKRTARLILVALIVLFVFQMMPLTAIDSGSPFGHAQNPDSTILVYNIHSNTITFSQQSRKPTLSSSSARAYGYFKSNSGYLNYSKIKSAQNGIVIDSRQRIQNSNPNYFHGSKYKNGGLFV